MSDIRKSLESLADSIEKIQTQPAPKVEILDRELSGNKIHGGRITKFSSMGILDTANDHVLYVKDDGIHVNSLFTDRIKGSVSLEGDLSVSGAVFAKKLHVDEISADVRNERTSPLEFKGQDNFAFGKGIIWTGKGSTKQLVLQSNPDRIWSSEDLDLHVKKSYKIGNQSVISCDSLGSTVVNSNLKSVGTLRSLSVQGEFNIDHVVKYDPNTERFSIGAEEPNGFFSLESLDHQFVIDPDSVGDWKIGSWTTSTVNIITDDTTRISIDANGTVSFKAKTKFQKPVGIGVNNFSDDVDLTVNGAIRFQNKKQEVADSIPLHDTYRKGDIVWNENPQPTGHIGWVCIKEGTPGDWKPFGQISG